MYTNSYILRVHVCTGRAQIASHDVPESLPPPVRHNSRKATIKVARTQCILTDYICCMPRVNGILCDQLYCM